jgi:hypothetical protein
MTSIILNFNFPFFTSSNKVAWKQMGCSHGNMYHNNCNQCLMFHVIENVIEFCVEIVGFTYMITFIIYHGNFLINLKLIEWIKNMKNH